MRIGLTRHSGTERWASLRQVFAGLETVLAKEHEVVPLRADLASLGSSGCNAELADFVRSCDLVINSEPEVFQARRDAGVRVPMIYLLLGEMGRGGIGLAQCLRYLTTADVLVANCTAESCALRKFVHNARCVHLSFGIDCAIFRPLGQGETADVRRDLGVGQKERIILYPGRITLEKNVHSLLQLFSVLSRAVPHAVLVVAGPETNSGFPEFGCVPASLSASLRRSARTMGIPAGRVHFLGRVPYQSMAALYSAADLTVNLSLHHDENFGYALVESMACGTPVVATEWGGLKDTLTEGLTGHHVKTWVTPVGVKIDWWTAVNRVADLLADDRRRRFLGSNAAAHAARKYDLSQFARDVGSLVQDAVSPAHSTGEPLRATSFARTFWLTCMPGLSPVPPYQRGSRAMDLYLELIASYAATSQIEHVQGIPGQDDYLLLASPIESVEDDLLSIGDPLYPVRLKVPDVYAPTVKRIITMLSCSPVLKTIALIGHAGLRNTNELAALAWLLHMGVMLRSECRDPTVDPCVAEIGYARPPMTVFHADRRADVVVLH